MTQRTRILARLKTANRDVPIGGKFKIRIAADELKTMRFGPEIVHVGSER